MQATLPNGATGRWACNNAVEYVTSDSETYPDGINDPHATVKGLSNATVNVFTWTVEANGCEQEKKVEIVNNSVDEAVITTKAHSECQTEFVLNANKPAQGNGKWTTSTNGISFTSNLDGDESTLGASANNVTVHNMKSNTEATFVWTVSRDNGNGTVCSDSKKVVIDNKHYDAKILTLTDNNGEGTVKTVCKPEVSLLAEDSKSKYNVQGYWTADRTVTGLATGDDAKTQNTNVNITVTDLLSGPTTFTWNVDNDLCGLATASIIVTNDMVTADAGDDFTACGTTAELNATVPAVGTGSWECISGTGKDDVTYDNTESNNYHTGIANLKGGNYTFRWTVVSAGDIQCSAYDDVVVSVNEFTVDADRTTEEDFRYICGEDATIQASVPMGEGWWTVQPSSLESNIEKLNDAGNEIKVTGITSSAVFTWHELRDGCPAENSITLYNRKPKAMAVQKYYTCTGNDVQLTATAAASGTNGHWEEERDYVGHFINPENADAKYTGMDANTTVTLNWIVTDELMTSCSDKYQVTVTNFKYEPSIFVDDEVICADNVELRGSIPAEGFIGKWSPANNDEITFTDAEASITTAQNLALGDNRIVWTVTNITNDDNNIPTCENPAEITITNSLPGVATILTTKDYTCDNTITLKAEAIGGDVEYEWSTDGGAEKELVYDDDHNVIPNQIKFKTLGLGNNIFTWKIWKGNCSDHKEITIVNNYVKAKIDSYSEVSCDNTAELQAEDNKVAYPGSTGKWESRNGSTFGDGDETSTTDYAVSVKNIPSTGDIFTWTVVKGDEGQECSDSKTVNILNYYINAEILTEDKTVCKTTETLQAKNVSGYGTTARGYWAVEDYPSSKIADKSQITFGDSNSYNTTVSGMTANGEYVFSWNVYHELFDADNNEVRSCEKKAVVRFTNTKFEVDADLVDADNKVNTCKDSYDLNATPLTDEREGHWEIISDVEGVTIEDTDKPSTKVTGIPTSGVTLKWIVVSKDGACDDESEITITNQRIEPVITVVEVDCNGNATLQGNELGDGLTGKWTPASDSYPGHFVDESTETAATQYIGIPTGTTVGLKWTLTNTVFDTEREDGTFSCDSELIEYVTNEGFGVTAGPNDITDCSDTYTLQGSLPDGATGEWTCSVDDVEFAVSEGHDYTDGKNDPNAVVTKLSNAQDNIFTWTVTKNNCTATSEVIIRNNIPSRSKINTLDEQTICENKITLTAEEPVHDTGEWSADASSVKWYEGTTETDTPSNNQIIATNMRPNSDTKFTWTVSRPNVFTPGDDAAKNCSLSTFITVRNIDYEAEIFTAKVEGEDHQELFICEDKVAVEAKDAAIYGAIGWWTASDPNLTLDEISNLPNVTFEGLANTTTTFTWHVQDADATCDEKIATIDITNSKVEASVMDDQIACKHDYVLEATALSNGANGEWSQTKIASEVDVNIASPNNYKTEISGMDGGSYKFTWTVTSQDGKCSDAASVTITDNYFTVDADLSTNEKYRYVCGTTTDLEAQAPTGEGHWEVPAEGVTISDELSNKVVVTDLASSATLKWVEQRGDCTAEDVITLTNRQPVVTAKTEYFTCNGTVKLNATVEAPLTGRWEKVSTSTPSLFENDGTVTDEGITMFSGMIDNSVEQLKWIVTDNIYTECENFVEATITNLQTTAEIFDVDDVCGSELPRIMAQAIPEGFVGTWSCADENVVFEDPNAINTSVSGLVEGPNEIVWTVVDEEGRCPGTNVARKVVYNNTPSQATITSDRSEEAVQYCGGNYNLKARTPILTNNETGVWTVLRGTVHWVEPEDDTQEYDAANNAIICNSTNTTVTFDEIGIDGATFVWTIRNGNCTTQDEPITIINNKVIADAGVDKVSCDGTASLSAVDPLSIPYKGEGAWTTDNDEVEFENDDNTLYNVKVSNLPAGATKFYWKVTKGKCFDEKSIYVTNNSVTASIEENALINEGETGLFICAPSQELTGNNLTGTGAKGIWVVGNPRTAKLAEGYESTDFNVVFTNFSTGVNTFKWIVNNGGTLNEAQNGFEGGCTKEDAISIVYNGIETSISGVDVNDNLIFTCETSRTFTGALPGQCKGEWKLIDGTANIEGELDNSTIKLTDIATDAFTTLRWTVTSEKNEECTASAEVAIKSLHVVGELVSEPTIYSCTGTEEIAAIAVSGAKCWWSPANESNKGTMVNSTLEDGETLPRCYSAVTTVKNVAKDANERFIWHVEMSGGEGDKKVTCYDYSKSVVIVNNDFELSAGTYSPTCNSKVTLNATHYEMSEGDKSEWEIVAGNGRFVNEDDKNKFNAEVEINAGSTLTLDWHYTKNGCPKTATAEIKSNRVIAVANDYDTCDDIATLTGSLREDEEGVWQESNENIIWLNDQDEEETDPDKIAELKKNPHARVKGLLPGNNPFTWTVTNGHCNDRTVANINYLIPDASITNLEVPKWCSDEYELSALMDPADNGYTGTWTPVLGPGKIENSTKWQTKVTNLQKGWNIIRWTVRSEGGCEGSSEIKINNVSPEIKVSEYIHQCDDHGFLGAIDPGEGNTGWWTMSSISQYKGFAIDGIAFEDVQNFETEWNNPMGEYTGAQEGPTLLVWHVRNNDSECELSKEVTVVNGKARVSAGDTKDIDSCEVVVGLFGTPLEEGETGVWEAVDRNQKLEFSDPYSNRTTILSGLRFGDNYLRWTITKKDGCPAIGEVNVRHMRYPGFSAGDDQLVCDPVYSLIGTDPKAFEKPEDMEHVVSHWEYISGQAENLYKFDNSTNYSTKVRNLGLGVNVLKWVVDNGSCLMEDEIVLTNYGVIADAQGGKEPIDQCDDYFSFFANMPVSFDSVYWDVYMGAGEFIHKRYYNPTIYEDSYEENPYPERCDTATVHGLDYGKNTITWNVWNKGCHTTDTVVINNLSPSKAVVTAMNVPICSTEYHLSGNAPRIGTGEWSKASETNHAVIVSPTASYTEVTNLATGENKFLWTITNEANGRVCKSVAEVILNNEALSVSAGRDFVVCEDFAVLRAADPSPYEGYWTPLSNKVVIENDKSYETKVTNLLTGDNTFRWTKTNGACHVSDEVTITVNKPTQAKTPKLIYTCTDYATLNANTPDVDEVGWWELLTGSGSFNGENTVINAKVVGLGGGANHFMWTIQRGEGNDACVSHDTLVVNSNNVTISVTTTQPEYCENKGRVIGATNVKEYTSKWTPVGGNASFTDEAANETDVTDLVEGRNTVRWSVTVPGPDGTECTTFKDLVVQNNTAPQAIVAHERFVCDTVAEITANAPPTGSDDAPIWGSWGFTEGRAVFENSTSNTTKVTGLAEADNYITWTIHKGSTCTSTDTMKLTAATIATKASGDNGTDTLTICGTATSISAAPAGEGAEGWWTTSSKNIKFVEGLKSSENSQIENVTPGLHNLTWHVKKANGCEATAPLIVVNDQYEALASLASANPVCNGEATVIGNVPVAGAYGYWDGPSSVSFLDSSQTVTTMYLTVQGNNQAEWHIVKGKCESVAYLDVYNLTVESVVGDAVIACTDQDVKTINAQPAPEDGSGVWKVVSGKVDIADSTSYVTSVTGIQQGTNTLRWLIKSREWEDSHGQKHHCESSDYLEVNNNYFTTNAGADREVCDTVADLRATYHGEKAKGHWSGGYFEDAESYKTKVTKLQPSKPNTFTWTVNFNGCEATDEVVITSTKVDIEITSGDKITCSNTTNLEARQSAGTGKWSIPMGGGKIDDPLAQSTMVNDLNPGENIVRWTVTYGQQNCVTIKEAKVNNRTINVTAGFNQNVCDTFATLAGKPLDSTEVGMWYNGVMGDIITERVGDEPEFDDPTLYNTRVTGLYYDDDGAGYSNPFTWFVRDTVTKCTGQATVQITSYHFNVDADVTTIDNYKEVEEPSIELRAKEAPTYTGRWDRITGNGTPTPAEGPVTTVTGLSQGFNQIAYTATLVGKSNSEEYVPPCKAIGYVKVAYKAFTVEAGQDRSICEDSIQLNAQKVPNAVSYWTATHGGSGGNDKIGFDDKSDPKTWVRGLSPGRNVLFWNVIKNGFLAQDSVVIYNYGFRVEAGEDQHLCEPHTTLHATGPLDNPLLTDSTNWKGDWDTPVGGVVYENRFNATTDIDSIKVMTNVLVWHVRTTNTDLFTEDKTSLTCYAADTVQVTYYTAPVPDFAINPKSAGGCSPFTFTFANTTINNDTVHPVLYLWNFGNVFAHETYDHDSLIERTFKNGAPYDSIVPVSLTTAITIPGNKTCYDTTTRNVTVYAVPEANFTATPTIQTQPAMNVNLYVEQIPDKYAWYKWEFGDNKNVVWNNNSEYLSSLVHTYDTYGEYTISLVVKNRYCVDTASQTIKILPSPPISTKPPTRINGCTKFDFTLDEGIIYYDSVRWDIRKVVKTDSLVPEANLIVKNGETKHYTIESAGMYWLYLSAWGPGAVGEVTMRTDTVVVTQRPVANFTTYPDTVRLPNIPLYTQNTSKYADSWYWDFGDGETSSEMEPTHYYSKPGDYSVSLVATETASESNCWAEKTDVLVHVEPEGMLRFPNAFRPDPTGPSGGVVDNRLDNFVFIPYPRNGVKAGTYLLEIFNRYGEKIYESTDVNIGWDGYYRGKLSAQDVYVYKCKCTFENGKIFKEIGNVTLLR